MAMPLYTIFVLNEPPLASWPQAAPVVRVPAAHYCNHLPDALVLRSLEVGKTNRFQELFGSVEFGLSGQAADGSVPEGPVTACGRRLPMM
jgi:hypothetical protein